ncbi:hypothetical protein PSCICJ_33660 [Pseudomonas cichorii]|uniref:Acetyltransferase n=1 Tax=Pseudomonas cichorii TaxID=36746 RepID=A0A3M4W329_PSECI|nr:acetyltransferase [Pseudomonas cichorii JBC1]RMR57632.1 Acetyltransferase [Pseudomonas cichorii]GFM67248.1 hypothetical protein PSCICJ_33660 [Pseudomonas cichorii]SDO53112.1 Acetyltransferase (GNAT) family protein [Pseudomonas cichorii]
MTLFAENLEPAEIALLKRATYQDAALLESFFRSFKEVAFCQWQDTKCLQRILTRETTIAYLAKDAKGDVVGAVLGGVLGTRGTINHLAVSPEYRGQGVGQCLVDAATADMKRLNVRRMFLFVDGDNLVGRNFWNSLGFHEPKGEITCEKDL